MAAKIHKCSETSFHVHFCETDIWLGEPVVFKGEGKVGETSQSGTQVRLIDIREPGQTALRVFFGEELTSPRAFVTPQGIKFCAAEDEVDTVIEALNEALELVPEPVMAEVH